MQGAAAEVRLRGAGEAGSKSAWFASVSTQSTTRRADVAFDVASAGVPSAKLAVPYPTRSAMRASWPGSHGWPLLPLHASPVAVRATITLPAVADMLVVPVASGVGSGADGVAPAPS